MSSTNIHLPWFETRSHGFVSLARHEHVLVRGWSGPNLPALVRAHCFADGGAAEAELQRQRGQLNPWRFASLNRPASVANLLADEIAARPHDARAWRDYADWGWRHSDPRATLAELHEAAELARSPAHAASIERDIEAHEHAHFGAWRRDLIAEHRSGPDGGDLLFRRGHLMGVTGMPKFTLDDRAPVALAELSIELRSASELGVLAVALERPQWRSLQRFEVRMACSLDEGQSAALLDLIWRTMPRLTRLELRAVPGAVSVGKQMLDALGRLLGRHRDVVCGAALECLTLDVHDPIPGWTLRTVSDLIDVLMPSGLRELEFRAPTIPGDLRAWADCSAFAAGLARCVLRRRAGAYLPDSSDVRLAGARPAAPPRSVEPASAELAVWADWLQGRGHALGELAMLWSMSDGEGDLHRREQIGRARANVERELACVEGVLEVGWSGPLIERARLYERPLAAKHDASATLERVLGSPASARLEVLELENIEPTTLAHLLRLARVPGRDAHAALSQLSALTISTWCRVDVGLLLDAMPNLQRLTCRTAKLGGRLHRPHLGLEALTLSVAAELGHREQARLFSLCEADLVPNLSHVTLELASLWGGRAIPFDRLPLGEGGHLTIRGVLREVDVDALMRWAAAVGLASLELATTQPPGVERQALAHVARVPDLRLLGPLFDRVPLRRN
jgi:hypothetical protein